MKKIIRFNLFLTFLAVFFVISATSSPIPDKTKTKKKKETPAKTMLLRDTSNCANYYEAKVSIKQGAHTNSCPSDCTDSHLQTIILEKTLKTCPKGKLFNPQKLACDFPENIVTCYHSPKCTNE